MNEFRQHTGSSPAKQTSAVTVLKWK